MKGKGIAIAAALVVALALAVGVAPKTALAGTCTSTGNGNWLDTGTWDAGCGGNIPQAGDDVVIASGHTVVVNTDTAALNSLTVNGTLSFDKTGAGRAVAVTSDLTVVSGGIVRVPTGGVATAHALNSGRQPFQQRDL